MSEERKMILQMLNDGLISVEDAEKLLDAVPTQEKEAAFIKSPDVIISEKSGISPKRISVFVSEEGRTKVNVRVPFSLLRVGLKLGKSFGSIGARYSKSPEEAEALAILQEIDIDEILSSIDDGDITLPYTLVDVDDDNGQHVEVILQ